jgi:uncharacterized OB-fold protein
MAGTFFKRLAEGVIVGVRCPQCERVYVPPKGFCEHCFRALDDVVELGNRGSIEAVTIVTAPFPGSPEVPYCVAYVRLEGATSSIANFVRAEQLGDGTEIPAQVSVGAAVKVVFAGERKGGITDFWFEPVGVSGG